MDAALLTTGCNEVCTQSQTPEHLFSAIEIMRLQNINTLQNKVDRVKDDATVAQHEKMTNLWPLRPPRRPDYPNFGRGQVQYGRGWRSSRRT
ncbi:hypothetical protein DD238_000624 [Peronospora effusa]|uniref:Tr-type G domain-containing protein n=1 Tax=Peronospora effusa TaxID=542832 RepID=A0A3M6VUJ6_9STRA|nr:hypothetical protein DD238_000624 [Peronospora effusa]